MVRRIIKFFKRPERLPIHIHQSTYPSSEFERFIKNVKLAINQLISY